ncbi:MAG TPA: hypothetical protein VFV98_07360 [Vicinamibacterales bacterium]|nr:hypothetical protein [Vicinamibacterales bacterium]
MFRRFDSALVRFVPVVAAVALLAPVVQAQNAPLPAARDIVAKYVKAIGGEAAYKAIKSVRIRGQLSLAAQGLSGDIEIITARPNKMRQRVTIAPIGTIEQGYDGKNGWSLNPLAGASIQTGRELAETKDDATFDGQLFGPEFVKEMTVEGRQTFEGAEAYKVKMVLQSGTVQTTYFDINTGLLLGYEGERASPQGVIPTTHIVREWKKYGTVLQPSMIVERGMQLESAVTVTAMEFDNVKDSEFDPPAEVRALIK